jgi:calcineurin-like phosphoesterase family protein
MIHQPTGNAVQVWFTADTHFGHGNIIKYCQRPFLSPEEVAATRDDPRSRVRISRETIRRHDNALIAAINGLVAPDDLLWIPGDFCSGGRAEAMRYRDRIRCQAVKLVWGNRDRADVASAFADCIYQGMIPAEQGRVP